MKKIAIIAGIAVVAYFFLKKKKRTAPVQQGSQDRHKPMVIDPKYVQDKSEIERARHTDRQVALDAGFEFSKKDIGRANAEKLAEMERLNQLSKPTEIKIAGGDVAPVVNIKRTGRESLNTQAIDVYSRERLNDGVNAELVSEITRVYKQRGLDQEPAEMVIKALETSFNTQDADYAAEVLLKALT